MIDKPWAGVGPLNYGMVQQRLEALACKEVDQPTPTSAMWKTPTGLYFSVSIDTIDARTLEGIVNWVLEAGPPPGV